MTLYMHEEALIVIWGVPSPFMNVPAPTPLYTSGGIGLTSCHLFMHIAVEALCVPLEVPDAMAMTIEPSPGGRNELAIVP
jgi:hypothetical protein